MSNTPSCQAFSATVSTPYGYRPSLAAGIVFSLLFGFSMLGHTWQTVRSREWWLSVFVIGSLCEMIGWIGRAIASNCPYSTAVFEMQLALLIIAPNFFTAGCYIVLGRLITVFGTQYSPLLPKTYLYIFCTSDLLSLVIQSIGGGKAAAAFSTPGGDTKPGTDIMVAGIIFQLVSISIFALLFTLVLGRARAPFGNSTMMQKLVIVATAFSTTLIFIRSIYRTIELLQGWRGYLIMRERYFVGLDGSMMILAVAVFNFANPGSAWSEVEEPDVLDELPSTNGSGSAEVGTEPKA